MPESKAYSEETIRLATRTLTEYRVAVVIVSYNAERHIESVLARITHWVAQALGGRLGSNLYS